MTKTARDFIAAAQEHGISWWPIRECSICGVPVGYEFNVNQVLFRSACGCSSLNGYTPRSWDDVAAHYNMQSHPDAIARYDAFWRFDRATTET